MEKIKLKIKNSHFQVVRMCFLDPVSNSVSLTKEDKVKVNILSLLYNKILLKMIKINQSNVNKVATLSIEFFEAYHLEQLLRNQKVYSRENIYELNAVNAIADQINGKIV